MLKIIREKTRSFLYLFIFLFLAWWCLISSLNIQEIIAGIVISFVLALALNKLYLDLQFPRLSLKRAVYFIGFLFVLCREIVKANLDVAYRVLHPKMPIRPGIVVIKTNLKTNIARFFLANSITLTPGTFTLDIIGDKLLIHWINVKSNDIKKTTEIIGEKFEKYLKEVFE